MNKTNIYNWSQEAMHKRNFWHYHANRIYRALKGKLHVFPEGVEPDEDETSVEKSRQILEKGY